MAKVLSNACGRLIAAFNPAIPTSRPRDSAQMPDKQRRRSSSNGCRKPPESQFAAPGSGNLSSDRATTEALRQRDERTDVTHRSARRT
jgi:hypothetical protein